MIKINIQFFGGRGASSSSGKKSSTRKKASSSKDQSGGGGASSNLSFNNRKTLTSSIKDQIDVDLSKAATDRQFAPRTGLNIDSRKLSVNEFNSLKDYANRKGIKIESNGVYDYFIRFKK